MGRRSTVRACPSALAAALVSVVALPGLVGCVTERSAPELPVLLDLGGDTVRLAPGARVLDIRVGDAVVAGFDPALAEAVSGDVIRLLAADAGPHALVFDAAESDSAAVAFLVRTDQVRALPFLQPNDEWIVSLEAAPAGQYVVRCLTHGGTVVIGVRRTRTGREE